MLRNFLMVNRPELIERCREKVAKRRAPEVTPAELDHGVPLFLDQLREMLPGGAHAEVGSGPSPGSHPSLADRQMAAGALLHGKELLRHDFTIEQVVHDYGDICQAITELAAEKGTFIDVREFGVLNSKLDNAIACAVTEYARRSRADDTDSRATLSASLHELRTLLNTSIVALTAMRNGTAGLGGATSVALDNSLQRTGAVLDRAISLTDASLYPPAHAPRAPAVSQGARPGFGRATLLA